MKNTERKTQEEKEAYVNIFISKFKYYFAAFLQMYYVAIKSYPDSAKIKIKIKSPAQYISNSNLVKCTLKIPSKKNTRYTRCAWTSTATLRLVKAAASLRPDARRRASFIRVKARSEIYRRAVNSREQELWRGELLARRGGSSFVYLARNVHRASRIKDTLFPHFPSSIRGCCCSNVAGAHVARCNIRVATAVSFVSRKTPIGFPSLPSKRQITVI